MKISPRADADANPAVEEEGKRGNWCAVAVAVAVVVVVVVVALVLAVVGDDDDGCDGGDRKGEGGGGKGARQHECEQTESANPYRDSKKQKDPQNNTITHRKTHKTKRGRRNATVPNSESSPGAHATE